MVKANSLLYAIFICLLVSVICGALLYFATLFTQLNQHYNLHEELYLHNQSLVNFALGNQNTNEEMPADENLGLTGEYESKSFGLLTLLVARSAMQTDTIASAQFIGASATGKTALHVANFTRPLSYSGTVKIFGDSELPSTYVLPVYINNRPNQIVMQGKTAISGRMLPEINPLFRKIFENSEGQPIPLSELEKSRDSIYFNSFFEPAREIYPGRKLGKIIVKGNFIIRSKDSLVVTRDARLEDVILMAPKIIFNEGFAGTVQAFATESIVMGNKVTLKYPSVLCVFNDTDAESKITIGENCKITGAVVLFGNDEAQIDRNSVEIEKGGRVIGDIYCSGKLMLQSTVWGSVYANRLYYRNASAGYENIIADVEINTFKKPAYFIGIPLFNSKQTSYGVLKKVL
jgi:cytoskeletal protein CcmA (bactofilin family)